MQIDLVHVGWTHTYTTTFTQTPHTHTNTLPRSEGFITVVSNSWWHIAIGSGDLFGDVKVYMCVGVWVWYEWVANGDSTNYYNYNRFFNLVMTLHVSCNTGRAIKHISLQIVMSLPWQPACWWWVRFSTHKVSHEHTIYTGCHGIITTCAE